MHMRKALTLMTGLMAGGTAAASSLDYSHISIDLGRLSLDDRIVIVDEEYSELGAGSISAAYQFRGGVFIGGRVGAATNSGSNSELTFRTADLEVGLPIPLGGRADLIPLAGFTATEVEVCYNESCIEDDDSGLLYGVGLRAWVARDLLEINAQFHDTTIDDSESVLSAGGALWWAHRHSLRLNGAFADSTTLLTLGYRYTFR